MFNGHQSLLCGAKADAAIGSDARIVHDIAAQQCRHVVAGINKFARRGIETEHTFAACGEYLIVFCLQEIHQRAQSCVVPFGLFQR